MPERQYRIHPAIGIARVGDAVRSDASNDFYFIGPEIPEFAANVDPQSGAQGEFKTPDGKVKPQAARFRIFEYEKGNDGKFRPVGEVTTNNAQRPASITWTAHLANRKANFCAFHGQAGAEDEPLFSSYGTPGKPTVRNEKKVKTNAERKKWLELDPGRYRNGGALRNRSRSETKQAERRNKTENPDPRRTSVGRRRTLDRDRRDGAKRL
jgi:L-Lysine epsilon oxidase N-terminal